MPSNPVLHVLVLLLGAVGSLRAQEALEIGSPVPPLAGKDASGRALSWDDFGDKVVLAFFHSEQMAYSAQGLEALLAELAGDEALREAVAVLLVGTGKADPVAVGRSFDAAGVQGRIVADPDRSRFSAYHVVAFPTVFTVGRDRKVRAVTKGFGPLMALKVASGARLAAGLIDEAEHRRALEAQPETERSAEHLRIARTVRMVRQLMAAGMLDQARESMLRVVGEDTGHVEAIGLLARILLRQGRLDEARPYIRRLEDLSPKAVEARRLRARLALLEGKPDAALRHLEDLPEADPEAGLLRGMAWEAKGEPAKAAALYRKVLEALLEGRG